MKITLEYSNEELVKIVKVHALSKFDKEAFLGDVEVQFGDRYSRVGLDVTAVVIIDTEPLQEAAE